MNVLTYGTFDMFHYGHLNLLMRARVLGDRLLVGLSTDGFNQQKGKLSHLPYEIRRSHLEQLRCVDVVFPEESWDQKIDDVQRLTIDIFVMGDDWAGKFDFLMPYCEVVYLSRTPDISTTAIKQATGGERR